MPDRTDKVRRLAEEAGKYELPYISKSRVMQWKKNAEHFRLKYLEGIREPETKAMRRGTNIHTTFEHYYEQATAEGGYLGISDSAKWPEDRTLWADFIEPYITNFHLFETRRWQEAGEDPEKYLPVGIEAEMWRDAVLGIEGEPEWMGLADVLLPAASLPQFPDDEGVIIVDFKTGKVPKPQYRDEGILMELEYYSILFEDAYDVAGAAAYYPREDELLVKMPNGRLRDEVLESAREMVEACNDYEGDDTFEINPGPLCRWSFDKEDESAFYGLCSECTWAVPANNKETFKHYVEQGYDDHDIAEQMGTSTNAVRYWKWKLNDE